MSKKKSLIEIRTGALAEGINELDFTCQSRDFEGRRLEDVGFTGEINVNVVADMSGDDITVTINTSAVTDRTCDRCLAPISKILKGTLVLFYTSGSLPEGEPEEHDEYRQIDKSTEYIDITEDVCDTVILSAPMKITCTNNPDCRLYGTGEGSGNSENMAEHQAGPQRSWQESLEKLKEKYR